MVARERLPGAGRRTQARPELRPGAARAPRGRDPDTPRCDLRPSIPARDGIRAQDPPALSARARPPRPPRRRAPAFLPPEHRPLPAVPVRAAGRELLDRPPYGAFRA